jgi:xanthine dehydrogenase accessory factor
MKEIFPTICKWTENNKTFAIATVIKTWGSSPRPIGSTMIISKDMEMAGSVSGGCVEGSVVKAAMDILKNGGGQTLSFGITDEEAWEVGLSCGGSIQVFLEKFIGSDIRKEEQIVWNKLKSCLENNNPCVLLTELINGPNTHSLILPDGQLFGDKNQPGLVKEGLRAYNERKNQILEIEDKQYFAHVFPRKSQMLIIGAAHITVDLVNLAKLYDFETIVIDPRGIFANKTQFTTTPDQIFEKYPEEVLNDFSLDAYSYAVILSHDPKIDDNALHILLKSDIAYIGALGSRKTHSKRVARLEAAGFSETEISRIHSPVGVDINAKKPSEIALSIMAEIIKTQNAFL